MCEQGVVVEGVYTRDVQSRSQYQSPPRPLLAVAAITSSKPSDYCSSSVESIGSLYMSFECPSEHTSVTVASSQSVSASALASPSRSTQLSTDVPASPCSTMSASQVTMQPPPPVPSSYVCSLSSVPLKTGILPPTVNVNINTSSVVTSITDAHQQCLDRNAFQPVTESDTGWKEFEEALSEEFDSSTTVDSSRHTKDVVSSSSVPQPPKPPSLMMLGTAFITLYLYLF